MIKFVARLPRSPWGRLLVSGTLLFVAAFIVQLVADADYGKHHAPWGIRTALGASFLLALGQLVVSLIWAIAEGHHKAHPRAPRYRPPRR